MVATLVAACRKPAPPPQQPCLQASAARMGRTLNADSIPSRYDSLFAAAATEFRVPRTILKAIGWVETRWQMVRGEEEFAGRPAAFGIMALRGTALARGAALARVSVEAARTEPAANIRSAAALLDADATAAAIDRSRPEAWEPVVARYSGIEIPEGRAAYTRDIDRALAPNVRLHLQVAPPCPPQPPPPPQPRQPPVQRPSSNFNSRPANSTGIIHVVIVHTCESGYTSCWSWLVSPTSHVSAHYVVDEDGAEISQLVREPDRAWHIAAVYDCALNRRHDCRLSGTQSNHFTIGVEHAGFVSQDSFPTSQLEASAALVCDVTSRNDIPRDFQHIVGHGQLQPNNRTDPGPRWPWVRYLHRIQADCGEAVGDDDDAYNDTAVVLAAVPNDWTASAETPGFYGGGYRWANTDAGATDAAVFSFRLTTRGPRTIEARWTSGVNRSARAAYAIVAAGGDTLAVVRVDQTTNGGRWQNLGTWTFPVGWSRVALLRRAAGGGVVVADALRLRGSSQR